MKNSIIKYHLLTLATILVWGTTFAITKLLLNTGLSPDEILFYRFAAAYAVVVLFFRMPMRARSLRDEVLFLLLGLSGGSLYFLTENTALRFSSSSNVALIISVTPLTTALLAALFVKGERFTLKLGVGSAMALAGVCCIIVNGSFVFQINPAGDLLALSAALLWGVYSLLIKPLTARYPVLFVTRKVFFYGLLTILPFLLCRTSCWHLPLLAQGDVLWQLLYLSLVASLLCFFSWNFVLSKIGVVTANNYLYAQPIVSLACGAIVLHEAITWVAMGGALLIIAGIYVAERGFRLPLRRRGR